MGSPSLISWQVTGFVAIRRAATLELVNNSGELSERSLIRIFDHDSTIQPKMPQPAWGLNYKENVMVQDKKNLALFFTELTPEEYLNGEACRCILCKGREGDRQVVEINGKAAAARIEIEKISLESEGLEVCYPICLKCQKFLEALISLAGEERQTVLEKLLLPFFALK